MDNKSTTAQLTVLLENQKDSKELSNVPRELISTAKAKLEYIEDMQSLSTKLDTFISAAKKDKLDKLQILVSICVSIFLAIVTFYNFETNKALSTQAGILQGQVVDLQKKRDEWEKALGAATLEFNAEVAKSNQEYASELNLLSEKNIKLSAVDALEKFRKNCEGILFANLLYQITDFPELQDFIKNVFEEKPKECEEQIEIAKLNVDKSVEQHTTSSVQDTVIENRPVVNNIVVTNTGQSQSHNKITETGEGWIYIGQRNKSHEWVHSSKPKTVLFKVKTALNSAVGKSIRDLQNEMIGATAIVNLKDKDSLLNIRFNEPSFFGALGKIKDVLTIGSEVKIIKTESTFNDHIWAKVSYQRDPLVNAGNNQWKKVDLTSLQQFSHLDIKATGLVSIDAQNKSGPEGNTEIANSNEYSFVGGQPLGKLLATFDPTSTEILDISKPIERKENIIYFRVNDKKYWDNSGAFEVEILGKMNP